MDFLDRIIHEILHYDSSHRDYAYNNSLSLDQNILAPPPAFNDMVNGDGSYGGAYRLMSAMAAELDIPNNLVYSHYKYQIEGDPASAGTGAIAAIMTIRNQYIAFKLKEDLTTTISTLSNAALQKLVSLRIIVADPSSPSGWAMTEEGKKLSRDIEVMRNLVVPYDSSDGIFDNFADALQSSVEYVKDFFVKFGPEIGQVIGSSIGRHIVEGEANQIVAGTFWVLWGRI